MADYGHCVKCGRHGWLPHACMEFEVAFEDCGRGEPYWSTVSALDAERAAEQFAEASDCEGDYTIIKAGDRGNTVVLVRGADGGKIMRFGVYGETVPQYYARELAANPTPAQQEGDKR